MKRWPAMVTSLNTLLPTWRMRLPLVGTWPVSSSPARSRKPKSVRMLLENCVQPRVSTISSRPGRSCGPTAYDDERGRRVAEDEMRLRSRKSRWPVMISGVTTRRALRAGAHEIGRDMQGGRRRGAAVTHVEGGARGAERMLDLDGHGRIGALLMRGGADDHVDVGARQPASSSACRAEETPNSAMTEISSRRRAEGCARHAGGFEDAVEGEHVARLHARRIDDEVGVGFWKERLAAAGTRGHFPARRAR